MKDFNDIGISRRLDWPRIQHLFRLGLFGAFLTLIGDLILGWGVQDETLTGILRMYSAYTGTSDGGIFASALLATIPVVVLFMFIEKHLVAGLTSGGVKG